MKVLYIHTSGVFGGASRSLTEMITHFEENAVEPFIITPSGSFLKVLDRLNIPYISTSGITIFDHSRIGHYRWARWLILIRELFFILPTWKALKKAKAIWPDIDLIHVNEIQCIPAVIVAKYFFKKPIVMHVRSVTNNKEPSLRVNWLRKLINKYVDILICIDETVKSYLPKGLSAQVIHNGFTLNSKMSFVDNDIEKIIAVIPKRQLTVAMIGILIYYKGVMEFLEAAKQCKENNIDVNFLLVGHNANKIKGGIKYILSKLNIANDVENDVKTYIEIHELQNYVHFLGFTPNVNLVYNNIDVLCFPSHLNAVGRPVFEAAFFKKPSIVAIENPKPDTIVHLETGICIPAKNSVSLFEAIKYYFNNPNKTAEMGNKAFDLAQKNFNIKINAQKVLSIYTSLLKDSSV